MHPAACQLYTLGSRLVSFINLRGDPLGRVVADAPKCPGGLPQIGLGSTVRRTKGDDDRLKPHQARPANSRLSVDTLTFSPSLIKRGTRISRPVSSLAGLVTPPLEESPRTPGSVEATANSTNT